MGRIASASGRVREVGLSRIRQEATGTPGEVRGPGKLRPSSFGATERRVLRSVRQFLVLLLALLWVPLTAHCRIASLPGLEFLRCAEEPGQHHDNGKASDEDCGCCIQEHGKYGCSRWEDPVTRQSGDLVASFVGPAPGAPLPPPAGDGVLTAAPPSPPGEPSWAFTRRLALPVRAPSSAS